MTLEIIATLTGFEPLKKSILGLRGFFGSSRLALLLEDTKNKLVLLARQGAPRKSRMLASSIHGLIRGFGTEDVQIRVGPSVKYGPYVEFDTRPHEIHPRLKRALFWYTYGTKKEPLVSKTGKVASLVFTFAQSVHHPGTRAQPYLRPALEEISPRFQRALGRIIRETMKPGA